MIITLKFHYKHSFIINKVKKRSVIEKPSFKIMNHTLLPKRPGHKTLKIPFTFPSNSVIANEFGMSKKDK